MFKPLQLKVSGATGQGSQVTCPFCTTDQGKNIGSTVDLFANIVVYVCEGGSGVSLIPEYQSCGQRVQQEGQDVEGISGTNPKQRE